MSSFELLAQGRAETGKSAARRLRRQGFIPAVVFGAKKSAQSIVLKENEVLKAMKQEGFFSHLLTLKIDGKPETVIVKDILRHPYKPMALHLDFQRVAASEKITLSVPLHFENEEKSAGVKAGGIISHLITALEIKCLPKDLPEMIVVDLTHLGLDHSIHLSEIKLPQGVELAHAVVDEEHDQPVVSVHKPRGAEEIPTTAPEGITEAAGPAETSEASE